MLQTLALTTLLLLAAASAVFALLAWRRAGRHPAAPTQAEIAQLLRNEIERLRGAGEEQARGLRQELAGNLRDFQNVSLNAFQALGQSLGDQVKGFGERLDGGLDRAGEQQRERLEQVGGELNRLTEANTAAQTNLRQAVESRLDAIRQENAGKLDAIRQTVDEKLQTTLDRRLGESFDRVVQALSDVHKGLGEMQTLAAGVGDLKKVLSNVSVRGALGEIQLAMLLEQFLSPEQVIANASVRAGSQERVEFAVKLPGRDGENEVLLPIDAKFPQEDYERLLQAGHDGDAEKAAEAGKALEARIKSFAKTIRDKYINPPRTTDFAILFLPTEGLFAEVLRRPGLFEHLQREHQVTLTGPTTLTAFLNALQMGFRSLAIQQRSAEVWQLLAAVRTEFTNYNDVVDKIEKQLGTAAKSVEQLGTRTRAMHRKLRDVDRLPETEAERLLGLDTVQADDEGR
ncbi:MAG: DNA recombination protein RmuC [Alphaproteobacteria bacterium]|nr:DNA recombination protein RmuC [Alphaproteobacteria bacterium]